MAPTNAPNPRTFKYRKSLMYSDSSAPETSSLPPTPVHSHSNESVTTNSTSDHSSHISLGSSNISLDTVKAGRSAGNRPYVLQRLSNQSTASRTSSVRSHVLPKRFASYGSNDSDHSHSSNKSSVTLGHNSCATYATPQQTLPSVKKPFRKSKTIKRKEKKVKQTWRDWLCCCRKKKASATSKVRKPPGTPYWEGNNCRV